MIPDRPQRPGPVSIDEYLDVRRHRHFRVALATPVDGLADPIICAEEHWKLVQRLALPHPDGTIGAQLIVFPELSMSGKYSLEDIHLQRVIQADTDLAIDWFLRKTVDVNTMIVFGSSLLVQDLLFNVAYVTFRGQILGIIVKTAPPNYAEFTEGRKFRPAAELPCDVIHKFGQQIPIGSDLIFVNEDNDDLTLGGAICEDDWLPISPSTLLAVFGAKVLFNLSGSPYQLGKFDWIRQLMRTSGSDLSVRMYSGSGHGESTTEVVYPGFKIIAERGNILAESPIFETENSWLVQDVNLAVLQADRMRINSWSIIAKKMRDAFPVRYIYFPGELGLHGEDAATYQEFIREYDPLPLVPKTDTEFSEVFQARVHGLLKRFEYLPPHLRKVVIGLSGGKDSTDVLLQYIEMVDRWGHKLGMTRADIIGVTMPGFGTSDETFDYATALGEEFGITFMVKPIKELAQMMFDLIGRPNLPNELYNEESKTLFENIQAWARKQILFALANALGGIVAGTSLGTEIDNGWTTYKGDSANHYNSNAAMGKSAEVAELEWLADTKYADQPGIQRVIRSIARSLSSPELRPLSKSGRTVQLTEKTNGPDIIRDFFAYWSQRFYLEPKNIFRIAIHTFRGVYTPAEIFEWYYRYQTRFFRQRFKANGETSDTVKVGSVAPGAHNFLKVPSDIDPKPWLENLNTIPLELR